MTAEPRAAGSGRPASEDESELHTPGGDARARLERLAAIFEHSTDAIVGKTLDGVVTDWNAAAERAYGWPAEEAIGRNIAFVFPLDRMSELGQILAALRRGEETGPYTTERLRKDGTTFPVLVTVSPIRDRSGRVAGGTKIARDLTNVRRWEHAEEELRLRDDFLAATAHDLQQPLVTIKGQAQLALRAINKIAHPGLRPLAKRLASISATATYLSSQINAMLDDVRFEAGRPLELNVTPTDLVMLVRNSVEEYQNAGDLHVYRLTCELPELIAPVDAVRLQRVLDNLLSNAVKYSPAGGQIVVSVARQGKEEQGGAWAIIAVQDNGVGIPAADLPRVFESRFRAENAAGVACGTGLGLASALNIAELHGGTIDVESRLGEGSTFALRLPL